MVLCRAMLGNCCQLYVFMMFWSAAGGMGDQYRYYAGREKNAAIKIILEENTISKKMLKLIVKSFINFFLYLYMIALENFPLTMSRIFLHKETIIKVPVTWNLFTVFCYYLLNKYETLPGAQSYDRISATQHE